jgi:hypothetical protein
LRARNDTVDDLVDPRALDEQPRAGAARLALVEEHRIACRRDRALEVGVGEDDVRRLATQLQRDTLEVAGRLDNDLTPHLRRARERDLVHVRMACERGAGGLTEAGHDG